MIIDPMTRGTFENVFVYKLCQNACLHCKNYVPHDDKTGKCLEMERRVLGNCGVFLLSVCNLWEEK
jgi:hypothetical protein